MVMYELLIIHHYVAYLLQSVRDVVGKLSLEVIICVLYYSLYYCMLQLDNVPVQLLVELSDVIIDCVKKGKASNGR